MWRSALARPPTIAHCLSRTLWRRRRSLRLLLPHRHCRHHWPLHPAALDPSYCRDWQYSCDTAPPFSPYGPGPMPRQEPASGAMRVQCHRCGGFGHISRNCATGRRMGPPVCFRCQRSDHMQAQRPGNQWR
ncbi:hypothetical protein HPB51_013176 [Rhipicephalus microplus]|uniref:CCHC-type domain-containing protein n=1 Tax=Rhipicephalus microplus TaxID=6941 RepID=A0A9J6E1V5_RHIMP|nr:hypothetical protein HPB51_013176 [Rhipicephalus microplus]